MEKYDLIIIGAGPAGLSSGIYAARAGLKTLILEKFDVGGQIVLTEQVDNYPGRKSVKARDLVETMKEQAREYGSDIVNDEVISVSGTAGKFIVQASSIFESRAIIIASGAYPKRLDIPGEKEFTGRGVSYCAVCDGNFFKDKEVCVVGGGNAAVEEALYLVRLVKKVNLIHRRSELRAVKILQDQLLKNNKANIIWDSIPVEIQGDKVVKGIKIRNVKNGQEKIVNTEGVFIYIGLVPNTSILKSIIALDEEGYIVTNEEMETNKEGIFACGDCRQKSLRQVITACAEGAIAASSVSKFIQLMSGGK